MGFSFNPNFSDVLQGTFLAALKTASTTELLASVSSSNATGRQTLLLTNRSDTVSVWVGPTGFTAGDAGPGIAIGPRESLRLDVNENIQIYLRTTSGTANVAIWELG